MNGRREIIQLIRRLEKQGFQYVMTRGGHWKVWHPHRKGLVFMPATPSDHRAMKNVEKELKKIGYDRTA